MITGHTVWKGPRGAVDRIMLWALNETKKPNIVTKTANFTVSRLRVNIHTINYTPSFSAPKMMRRHTFWGYRKLRGFFQGGKVKHSELRKSTAHLKHTPLLKTTGRCILRLANNGFLTAHVVLLSNRDKLLSDTSLTTITNIQHRDNSTHSGGGLTMCPVPNSPRIALLLLPTTLCGVQPFPFLDVQTETYPRAHGHSPDNRWSQLKHHEMNRSHGNITASCQAASHEMSD